ncbi:hypothetical protein A7982_13940 [Minicystis rosea]|nr:hypothetical protein A7982_13940 [Minicystis rosea]
MLGENGAGALPEARAGGATGGEAGPVAVENRRLSVNVAHRALDARHSRFSGPRAVERPHRCAY